jgi:hypothetical protein
LDFTRLQITVDRRAAFQRQLLDRIRSIPGVDEAPNTNIAPVSGDGALLFGLKPRDPATLAGAALLLALVTAVASLVPSMRAANVNPIDSLRTE